MAVVKVFQEWLHSSDQNVKLVLLYTGLCVNQPDFVKCGNFQQTVPSTVIQETIFFGSVGLEVWKSLCYMYF